MLKIYTDGSCVPNPGNGGWAFVVIRDGQRVASGRGGTSNTTNNRMEMQAVLSALQKCQAGYNPLIVSDSDYVITGCTTSRQRLIARDYTRGEKRKPVPNADLWRLLHAETTRVGATFEWVRGHNGDVWNEEADRLAELGRMEAQAAT